MRLGGPVWDYQSPDQWVQQCRDRGYTAAYCPVDENADAPTVAAYVAAAKQADIVIAEVGAWSNPISTDDAERQAAIDKCIAKLDLADRTGARCCVNIAGHRGDGFTRAAADNFSSDTFDLIVQTVQQIIDAVNPTRTVYALETMPWMLPDTPEGYMKIVDAIDRQACGIHLDPINMITSPRRYFENGKFIEHCFDLLGDRVASCHAKDILLTGALTVELKEMPIGQGGLDFAAYLRALAKLPADTPLIMEHMKREEYEPAAHHLRHIAHEIEVTL